MAAWLGQIKAWFEEAEAEGATHMLVVCDTFDWEDYPVSVMPGQDPHEVAKRYDDTNMQRIMECYKISLGWEPQSKERRAFHWD